MLGARYGDEATLTTLAAELYEAAGTVARVPPERAAIPS
jgi:hypothetical protein